MKSRDVIGAIFGAVLFVAFVSFYMGLMASKLGFGQVGSVINGVGLAFVTYLGLILVGAAIGIFRHMTGKR